MTTTLSVRIDSATRKQLEALASAHVAPNRFSRLKPLPPAPRDEGGDRNDAILRLLGRQRTLNFTPGTEYQYNNGGYAMLASIVKRVSGQSLPPFAEANIFRPLGMSHTHFHDDPTMIVPNRASGYFRDAGAWRVSSTGFVGGFIGNSGLQTTAQDLLRWEQNFADVRVGDPALLAAMQAPTL